MMTLYSYPGLYGVADNNGYGLKVFAFLRLAGLTFTHKHIVDASSAPRGQLPYLVDGEEIIGDSDSIIAYLMGRYELNIDDVLTPPQQDLGHMVRRTLDDLYWVMSYSRWQDERYWPTFRDALRRACPELTDEQIAKARDFNHRRYHFQGIGRYTPAEAYARGVADLMVLSNLVPEHRFVFGDNPTSTDASIYGFISNIYFYDIDTPLRKFVSQHANLITHCQTVHSLVSSCR